MHTIRRLKHNGLPVGKIAFKVSQCGGDTAGVHVHSFRWGRYYRVEAHDLTAAQMADVFATAQKPELAMLVKG
jgi:hypothetical protein